MPKLNKTETKTEVKEEVKEEVKTETQPVAETAAPVVEETTTVTEEIKEKKPTTDRKKPNRPMTPEDANFVVENVKNMSYSEIAEARGITKHQVNRVLMQVKKQLREAAGDDQNALAAVEAHIKEHLSRPEDTLPGAGGGRASVVKSSIDDIVGNILNSIS
jgi:beta-N-acetylglucosaminidase